MVILQHCHVARTCGLSPAVPPAACFTSHAGACSRRRARGVVAECHRATVSVRVAARHHCIQGGGGPNRQPSTPSGAYRRGQQRELGASSSAGRTGRQVGAGAGGRPAARASSRRRSLFRVAVPWGALWRPLHHPSPPANTPSTRSTHPSARCPTLDRPQITASLPLRR